MSSSSRVSVSLDLQSSDLRESSVAVRDVSSIFETRLCLVNVLDRVRDLITEQAESCLPLRLGYDWIDSM